MVTIDGLQKVASVLSDGASLTPDDVGYRLVTILHDWHTIVHYDPSRLSKVNDSQVI